MIHRIAAGVLTVVLCLALVPALPEPIGSTAEASETCETTCMAAFTATRAYCHSSRSSCEEDCVRETDTYSAERVCKRECRADEDSCLRKADWVLRGCRSLC